MTLAGQPAHPEDDGMVQIVVQLVQIAAELVLVLRVRLGQVFVVRREERPRDAAEDPPYSQTAVVNALTVSPDICLYCACALTLLRCGRSRTKGRI